MNYDLLVKACESSKSGQSCAFATIIETTLKGTPRKSGAKMVVSEDGSSFGTIGGGRNEKAAIEECLKAIKSGKPSLVTYNYFGQKGQSVCGGQMKVYIEPFLIKNELIICGAGHIALPLSILGKINNFTVTIIDNRKEFANKKRFGHVDQIILGRHLQSLQKINIGPQTYIMVVTQGNEYDYECLKAVVKTKAAYIGVISSKPKRIKFFNRLKESGISKNILDKIKIPAGIDIGAQTPEEIAVSIMAEMLSIKNKDFLQTDKFKEKFKNKILRGEK